MLFQDRETYRKKVLGYYGLTDNMNILLYAPSFRDYFYLKIDTSVYAIDYQRIKSALAERFGGEWRILTRWHPLFADQLNGTSLPEYVLNVTSYPDMQELIMATDVLISDYSSCLFDAALREIPCFTFATDFKQYKTDRGVYYEMEELPFPYATNNNELELNIRIFNPNVYKQKWKAFKERTGLYETGHAGRDIAEKINDIIQGQIIDWSTL